MIYLRYIILFFVSVGIAFAFAHIAIYTRELPQYVRAPASMNRLFSIVLIPICLAIVTNIFVVWKSSSLSVNKGILFAISILSILIAISIIHERYSGHLWNVFTGSDGIIMIIALFVISLAIATYFGAYFVIRIICDFLRKRLLH